MQELQNQSREEARGIPMYEKSQVNKKEIGHRDFSEELLQKKEKLTSVETEETSVQEGAKKPEKEVLEFMKIQNKRETEKMSLPRSYASVLMSTPLTSKGENKDASKVSNFINSELEQRQQLKESRGRVRSDSLASSSRKLLQ